MDTESVLEQLAAENRSKIVLLVMDGLGGLPYGPKDRTELQAAKTPNLDKLAPVSTCGLLDPVSPGITPGSGPSHLALFGYDPIKWNIGRGVLAALGIDFNLEKGDLCARINFASVDKKGILTDRRAGRISTDRNIELCTLLRGQINCEEAYKVFIEPVKEHRAVLVIRGAGLSSNICDTDPQKEGLAPLMPKALSAGAEAAAEITGKIISKARETLKEQPDANMILLRGFAEFHPYPSLYERFKIKSLAIAGYPMYRGLAKLVGMDVVPFTRDLEESIEVFRNRYADYDFFYIHVKKTDSYGEDGNFDAKVHEIEETDRLIPKILNMNPDVFAVTCDHSTPSRLKAHSWHPAPVLIHSQYCRKDGLKAFSELNCAQGSLGRTGSVNLMPILLANALRLKKYGA